ncbi:MAG: ATP-binding protein [Flavobacteriaceae bacterium]|nr:ATP-binding protein [Formosa sp.]MDG1374873.1 ATP-binding protein [Flavobacteriaceae bacterium]MDG2498216.1 ATP-binding protein [Flavobacteriaceae bacterium]
MKTQKIVLIGGPGTGKTTLINALKIKGYNCMEEISRQVTLKAQEKGIEQLFLEDPLLFSEHLLLGRQKQFLEANALEGGFVFFDRGIPDVVAYLDYLKTSYPNTFKTICSQHIYDKIFILKPWKAIYKQDNERYETFEQALILHDFLVKTYTDYGYTIIDTPFGTVEERLDFILNHLNKSE